MTETNRAQQNLRQVVGDVLEGWTLPEGVRKILEAAYYADPVPVFRGPAKFTAEEIEDGYRGIRWITAAGVYGRPSNCDVRDYLTRTPSMNICTCHACRAFYAASISGASNEPNLGS